MKDPDSVYVVNDPEWEDEFGTLANNVTPSFSSALMETLEEYKYWRR